MKKLNPTIGAELESFRQAEHPTRNRKFKKQFIYLPKNVLILKFRVIIYLFVKRWNMVYDNFKDETESLFALDRCQTYS